MYSRKTNLKEKKERRRSSYTGRRRRRRSVTPCSGDYVATNGWLTKGCSREEQGAVVQPHFKRLERDERAEDNKWPPKQRCVRPRTAPNSSKVHRQAGSTVADRACDSPLGLQGKDRKATSAAPSNHCAVATHNKSQPKEPHKHQAHKANEHHSP
jgi:hypothetical protein